jgi:hypothetical protein
MSNHIHIVLFIDENAAKSWSTPEVLERWHQLFKGTLLTQHYCRGETLADYLQETLDNTVKEYRSRLMDISWFMRLLNEGIARQANQPNNLLAFIGNPRKNMPKGLPFELKDYLELIELTGRCIRADKVH